MTKRLYKSNTNKVIDGVCGGIAEYFDLDPTVVRVAWAIFCVIGFSGVIARLQTSTRYETLPKPLLW